MGKQIKVRGRLKGVYLERDNSRTTVFLSVSFPQAIFHPMKVGNESRSKIEWWEYYHFSTRTIIAIKHETFYITSDDKYVTFKIPALDLKIPIFSLFPESTVYIKFKEEQAQILPHVSTEEVSSPVTEAGGAEDDSQQEQESIENLEKLSQFMDKYRNFANGNKHISILVINNIGDMKNAIEYISIQYAR
jgi:hypothetical protein